ncbi:DUF5937 family protein [Rugosimonospora acidiphila]|uniref:DUF5937 family protein n=1 Tax=Rugosimonospora acidiphila TaxID=556531 RepID=A0ABP9SK41_9ACTN
MLQLRLTMADLAKVRFAVSATHQIGGVVTSTAHQAEPAWHKREQQRALSRLGAAAAPLMRLRQHPGSSLPDFVTPPPRGFTSSLDDEIDDLLATPDWRVEHDLREWSSADPRLTEDLLADARQSRRDLGSALRAIHFAAFGDDWPETRRLLRQDAARRIHDLGCRGIDYVLENLHPRVRWDPPVLTVGPSRDYRPVDMPLNGQGLVLVPSLSWSMTFRTKINGFDPVVLVYPAAKQGSGERVSADHFERLADLLGRTRARVLLTIYRYPGLSTNTLAVRCAISAASASEHAGVLRHGRLSVCDRRGQQVSHRLTELGIRLVERS